MMLLYLPKHSWLHQLPAGVKLALLAGTATGLTLFAQLGIVSIGLILIVLAYVSLGRAAVHTLKPLKPLFWLMLMLFFLQSYTLGWSLAALISLRMLCLVLLAQLVTLTTRLDDLLQALMPLLRPLNAVGVDPARISFTIALVIRFIPVLLAQYHALKQAWQARGGRKRPWVLLSPLLIQSLQLTEHVALAIAARGGMPNQPQPSRNPDHE